MTLEAQNNDSGMMSGESSGVISGDVNMHEDMPPGERAALEQQAEALYTELYQAYLAAEEAAQAARNSDPPDLDAAQNMRANAQKLMGMSKAVRSMSPRDIRAGGLGSISIVGVAAIGQNLSERTEQKYEKLQEQAERAAYGSTYFREAGYAYSPYDMSSPHSQQYWAQRAMTEVDNLQKQQSERFVTDANGNITSMKGSGLSAEQLKDMTSLTTVDKADVSRDMEAKLRSLANDPALSEGAKAVLEAKAAERNEQAKTQQLEVSGSDYNKAVERTWDKLSDAEKAALGGNKEKYLEGFAKRQEGEGAFSAEKSEVLHKTYQEKKAAIDKLKAEGKEVSESDMSTLNRAAVQDTEATFYDKFLKENEKVLGEGAQDQALKDERVYAAVDIAIKKAGSEGKLLSKEELEKVIKEAETATEKETPEKRLEIIAKAKEKQQENVEQVKGQEPEQEQAPPRLDGKSEDAVTPGANHSTVGAPTEEVVAKKYSRDNFASLIVGDELSRLGIGGGQHVTNDNGMQLAASTAQDPQRIAQMHQALNEPQVG